MSAGGEGNIGIWRTNSVDSVPATRISTGSAVQSIEVNLCQGRVLSVSSDKTIAVWNIADGSAFFR